MTYIIVLITHIVLYTIESFHDFNLEKLYNQKEERGYVLKWHRLDWLFHVIYASLVSYLVFGLSFKSLLLLVNIGFVRQLILNSFLNLIKGKDIWYLGETSNIDILIKKIEKIYFFFLIIVNIVLPFIIYNLK